VLSIDYFSDPSQASASAAVAGFSGSVLKPNAEAAAGAGYSVGRKTHRLAVPRSHQELAVAVAGDLGEAVERGVRCAGRQQEDRDRLSLDPQDILQSLGCGGQHLSTSSACWVALR
jgi:hypothetical protein